MSHSISCLCLIVASAAFAVAQDSPAKTPATNEQPTAETKPADPPAAAAEKPAEPEAEKPKEQPAAEKPKQEAKPNKPAEDKKPADEKKPAEEKKPEEKAAAKPADASPKSMTPIGYTDTQLLPGQPWRIHDLLRPRPRAVTPGADSPAAPPSDAIVLFDGTDLSNWGHQDSKVPGQYTPARWTVKDGYMESKRGTGYLCSLDNVGSCQLHIEWASPKKVVGDGQGRGNSGIKLWGAFEVQVLDSYNNRTYADGQAGAVYGQYPPAVNATLPPGEWQAYDVIYEMPEFDDEGKLTKPAYLTVFHNGVLLHHHRELTGPTGRANSKYSSHPPGGSIMLQDHGNPVRYRNIWVRPL
ncbi:family 16 glycoside hydrolase [Rosistilla oblonga]|uniref:3-keto-disaccharide hydrolase n=1 Tax=Rosistilla oblonga TaxID=2527990 RepID=UPI003A96C0F9